MPPMPARWRCGSTGDERGSEGSVAPSRQGDARRWAADHVLDHSRYAGEISYAIGLGSLAPLAGFLILVGGESVRVFRLIRRIDDHTKISQQHPLPAPLPLAPPVSEQVRPGWKRAFRQEAAKWGILVTMTVFVITLVDRHAEVLAVASFLIGTLLNVPVLNHSTSLDRSS